MVGTPKFGFVIEYVSDIEKAKQFYTEVLGLDVQRYHPTFVQFEHFAIASDESMGGNRQPENYWLVDDAEAAYADLSGKAEVSLPLKETAFGKVFGIKDPDGQPIYLLQFSQSRPSRPVNEE